jgi:glyoxylase I family protein
MQPRLESFAPLLQVFDMPRSIAFYRDILAFEVIDTSPPRATDDFDWVLLRRDGIDLMLNTAYEHDQRPEELPAARRSVHRDTGLFFGCRDLEAAYSYLKAKGLDVKSPSAAPYGMNQLWLTDPDGYVLCLQWPVA